MTASDFASALRAAKRAEATVGCRFLQYPHQTVTTWQFVKTRGIIRGHWFRWQPVNLETWPWLRPCSPCVKKSVTLDWWQGWSAGLSSCSSALCCLAVQAARRLSTWTLSWSLCIYTDISCIYYVNHMCIYIYIHTCTFGRHTTSMVHMSADEHQEAVWARSTKTDGYLLDPSQIMMRNPCPYAEHAWSPMHSKFSPQDLWRHMWVGLNREFHEGFAESQRNGCKISPGFS